MNKEGLLKDAKFLSLIGIIFICLLVPLISALSWTTPSDVFYFNTTGIFDSTSSLFSNITNLFLGRYFNGSIDDVMIFNRSLTSDEVKALYNATALNYYSNFSEGVHSYEAYTQDFAGNINMSSVDFEVDLHPEISINTVQETNTTDVINVNGRIAFVDGVDVANNLFYMRLNDVLVSSDEYNYSSFSSGTGTGVNISSNVSLNLSLQSSITNYTDDFSTTLYTSDSVSYSSVGYYAPNGVLFELDAMTSAIGNITYRFSSPTRFYSADAYITTQLNPSDAGGTTSIYYSLDNSSWVELASTTSSNTQIGGSIPVNSDSFYVMLESNTNNFNNENPITFFEVNTTNYEYPSIGQYTSPSIYLPDVAYTVLRWTQNLSGGEITLQLRESSDNSSWSAWSDNYTNYASNDISSFTEDYIQFRAFLETENATLTPVLKSVDILYFNATTNSTGGYSYNITIPTNSLGVLPLEVSVLTNPENGIIGTNYTNITVWARTEVPYTVVRNYTGSSANYSVVVNFTRSDTGDNVNGTFNIVLSNSTYSDSQSCSALPTCVVSWLVPDDVSFGNYTINISAYNESAYYINTSDSYIDYLEQKNTQGTFLVPNKTIGDFMVGQDYLFYINASITNTGNASMNSPHVYDYQLARSAGIKSISEITPCGRIYPGTICNATLLITVDGNANVGEDNPHFISWRTTWTDNDGGLAGGLDYISYSDMWVIIIGNSTMSVSNESINVTIQHESLGTSQFNVISSGSTDVSEIEINFLENNFTDYLINSSWVNFSTTEIALMPAGVSQTIYFNVTIPAQSSPGNYSGVINVSSANGGDSEILLRVEVPSNGSWYTAPSTNFSYNNSYSINVPGQIANFTLFNEGNFNLTLNLSYSSAGTTDYRGFGTNLFETNYLVNGTLTNPTSVNVTKGRNATIILWQKGNVGPLPDVGIIVNFYNASASPSVSHIQDSFTIVEQPPAISNIYFNLDGVSGNKAEVNKNLTIKIRATDDVNLNSDMTKIYINWSGGSTILNGTPLNTSSAEYTKNGIYFVTLNFTGNFTPSTAGLYNVSARVSDSLGYSTLSSVYNFTSYGNTTMNLSRNVSSISSSIIDLNNGEIFSINYYLNNTGQVSAYSPTLNFSISPTPSYGNITLPNQTFSTFLSGVNSSVAVSLNISRFSAPGNYTLTETLGWRNPDNSYSTNVKTMSVSVLSNLSLAIPSLLNYTVNSGEINSSIISLNNTGNDNLTNISISCVSGTLCSSLDFSVNESNFNISVNSSYKINLSLSASSSLGNGIYEGVLNVSGLGISKNINISAYVPQSLVWTISSTSINSTKGVNQSGVLETIIVSNLGNLNLTLLLNSSNSSIVTPNQSSLVIPKLQNSSFDVNYSSPSEEGSYLVYISVGNSSASPSERNISINLTSTSMEVLFISPTNDSVLSNVTPYSNITIRNNVTYGDSVLTSNINWSFFIGGESCSYVSSVYDESNDYWESVCSAPNLSDGLLYDILAIALHDTYGEVSATETNSTLYRDLTPPVLTSIRNNINVGGTINLSVDIIDNVNVSSASFVLTYPSSSSVEGTLTRNGDRYSYNSLILSSPGEYLVNYSVSDATGNSANFSDWFEVYDRYVWNSRIVSYNSIGVDSLNLSWVRPLNYSEILMNVTTNSTGGFNLSINKRIYDFIADFGSGEKVWMENVNFTNVSSNNITFNLHSFSENELEETVPLFRPFRGIASNSTGFENVNLTLYFNYSGYNYDYVNSLTIVKCSDWVYSSRACNDSWSQLNSSINKESQIVSGSSTGFSAYLLSESTCGNGLCEVNYGETIALCSEDCKETSVSVSVSSGGGGGGGGSTGLSDADLDSIEKIIKSFIDVGGIKIETAQIYKEMFAGDTTTFRVKIRNVLSEINVVDLEGAGDVKEFLFFDSSHIELAPNEIRDIIVKIIAPKFIEPSNYDGELLLKVGEEEGKIPVTVRILEPEGKLMDVKIQPLTPIIAPGEVLRLQTDLLNLGKTKKIDVQFDLQLLDINTGEILERTEEAFAVETTTSLVKNITIPKSLSPGRYMVKATAYYSNKELDGMMEATSLAYITVQYPFLKRELFGIPMWVYLISGLAISGLVGAYFYLRWLAYSKKRFKLKVELNKLPQAGKESAFVGNIAETGIRAFTDLNKLQMHTLVAGATGSGKTVAAQDIVEEALIHGKSVIVFDPTAQWTGFLRKSEDANMIKRYKFFSMKGKDARAFNGSITTVHDPYEVVDIKKHINKPGEITIINVSHLSPKEIDIVVASTIEQIFKSEPEESRELKTLIVYDEVHRLLPKFGGSGQGFIQLERGAREFRKWGIGLVLISQVLSDFVGEVKANIGTEIQMGTRYEGDLDRVNVKYGEDALKSLVRSPIGTGMIVNAEYNSGKPYFVSFRPLLHSTRRLSNVELAKYEKYFLVLEDIEYQVLKLKEMKVDVLDLELEIKLVKEKVKSGQFQMADMYFESLNPRLEDSWKKIGRKPIHLVKEKIKKEEVIAGIKKAKEERVKYIKKNPSEVLSIGQEISDMKKKIEELKKKGKKTSDLEIKLHSLEERVKPFKGKVPARDAQGISAELNELKKEVSKI
jgi:hypothetical protein